MFWERVYFHMIYVWLVYEAVDQLSHNIICVQRFYVVIGSHLDDKHEKNVFSNLNILIYSSTEWKELEDTGLVVRPVTKVTYSPNTTLDRGIKRLPHIAVPLVFHPHHNRS